MIKQSITNFFDNYESNKITDVPIIEFRPNRDIFHYLIPEKVQYKDLRTNLKPKPSQTTYQSQTLLDTFKRYLNEFQFRKSAHSRVLTHTLEYATLYGLTVFGFYSRHLSGWKRSLFVLKQTSKSAFTAGTLYGMNQLLYPFYYKLSKDTNKKNMYTIGNLISALLVWPLIALIEWNLLVSIRKTMFICAFGQFRDSMTELQRFYKLNPDHIISRAREQANRILHPSEDISKRFRLHKQSRASIQRQEQEGQQLHRQVLAQNKGQKIPSTNLFIMMPEIYRRPTKQESEQHERKAAIKTKQILEKKGITWVGVVMPQEKKAQLEKQKQQNKQKKSWLPW